MPVHKIANESVEILGVYNFMEFVLSEENLNKVVAYRGHGDARYELKPSIFRDSKWEESEDNMLRDLMSMFPDEFSADQTVLERLVRAQHYGMPTRLLDVTFNPLAALYFSCAESEESDGAVEVIVPDEQRIKPFDSDTVNVLANLSLLKWKEKKEIEEYLRNAKKGGRISSVSTSNFNKLLPVQKLVALLKLEKPYFENKIRAISLSQIILVKPKLSNRRILAQSGAFCITGYMKKFSNATSKKFRVKKLLIPKENKPRILSELQRMNISRRTLFPEIESASLEIKRKYAT